MSPRVVEHCLAANVLHLIILPTEACNFRCTYCYEEFRHSRMKDEVVTGIKRLLAKRAGSLDQLALSWFGGEPLLARSVVEDVMRHVRSLAQKHHDMDVASDITTNGYNLTREVFDRLVGLGVTRYMISFDGPREFHNRKRVLANGGGTFDRIWKNVTALKDAEGEFSVVVRLHLDRENLASAPEFVADFEATFGLDPRFKLFVRKLSALGGPGAVRP